MSSVVNRYYDPSTDQFLSIDPDVESTDQPYVFVGDDPLNADDPLGLMLQTLVPLTDRQVAAVGLASEIMVNSNALNDLQSTGGVQLHADLIALEDAEQWGSKDIDRLQRRYNRALNNYVKSALPFLNAAASDVADFYTVTSSYLKMSVSQGTYEAAYDALQPFIGTGSDEESALTDAVDQALSDAIPDLEDFMDSLQDVAQGGGVAGVVVWYFLWWFGD